MSKKKNIITKNFAEHIALELSESSNSRMFVNEPIESNKPSKATWLGYLKNPSHWWVIGLITFLSLGTVGAGLKYLEEDAQRQKATKKPLLTANSSSEGWLNSINPFVEPPLPTATPQLSKEIIYSGSRMLAVEDANASAVPPADLAVWRPSTGYWLVLGGQGSQQTFFPWGQSGDVTVPGDYDGDGKTDFSVYRPSNGNWYIKGSGGSLDFNYVFGTTGDQAAPADYDGDGKTDAAVFRSSNGTWYIQRSSDAGLTVQAFGLSSDKPAPADYDGDGRADVGVWRGSDLTFYALRSSDATYQVQAIAGAASADTPVSADYDGDGRADFAVKSSNIWRIKPSSSSPQTAVTWQTSNDKEVQNDYDADGRVDVAVWRESNGTWYIRQSSRLGQADELRQVAWGTTGDIPVPAYYRR